MHFFGVFWDVLTHPNMTGCVKKSKKIGCESNIRSKINPSHQSQKSCQGQVQRLRDTFLSSNVKTTDCGRIHLETYIVCPAIHIQPLCSALHIPKRFFRKCFRKPLPSKLKLIFLLITVQSIVHLRLALPTVEYKV